MSTPHNQAIAAGLSEAAEVLAWLRRVETIDAIAALGANLSERLERGGRIITCGNGGSMCDAMHFAEELGGQFRRPRRALPGMALSDASFLTCVANDMGFELVFARGVEAWGSDGDSLVVFSTSGQSPNILAALRTARSKGLFTVGLLGRDGGAAASLCDTAMVVPASGSDRIQEAHIKIVHLLIEQIEQRLFGAS